MTTNPFWGSINDQESKEEYRRECEYLLRTSRMHIRVFRLIIRKDLLTDHENAVLNRIKSDLEIISTGPGRRQDKYAT